MSAAKASFQGKPLTLLGKELKVGDMLPQFTLTGVDMADLGNDSFQGKVTIISAVPSLDTPVCAIETKKFNDEVSKLPNDIALLTVSLDLPFAQKRWCGAEHAERVVTGSDYKYHTFGKAFGVLIEEWGLLARSIFVADKTGKIVYIQHVGEISSEPNYTDVLEAAKKALG